MKALDMQGWKRNSHSVHPPFSGRDFIKFPAALTPLTLTFSLSLSVSRTAEQSWFPKALTNSTGASGLERLSVRLPSAQLAWIRTTSSDTWTHSITLWQQSRMNATSVWRQGYWQSTPTARTAPACLPEHKVIIPATNIPGSTCVTHPHYRATIPTEPQNSGEHRDLCRHLQLHTQSSTFVPSPHVWFKLLHVMTEHLKIAHACILYIRK